MTKTENQRTLRRPQKEAKSIHATMVTGMATRLVALVGLMGSSNAFYLPGVNPQSFEKGAV